MYLYHIYQHLAPEKNPIQRYPGRIAERFLAGPYPITTKPDHWAARIDQGLRWAELGSPRMGNHQIRWDTTIVKRKRSIFQASTGWILSCFFFRTHPDKFHLRNSNFLLWWPTQVTSPIRISGDAENRAAKISKELMNSNLKEIHIYIYI